MDNLPQLIWCTVRWPAPHPLICCTLPLLTLAFTLILEVGGWSYQGVGDQTFCDIRHEKCFILLKASLILLRYFCFSSTIILLGWGQQEQAWLALMSSSNDSYLSLDFWVVSFEFTTLLYYYIFINYLSLALTSCRASLISFCGDEEQK